MMDELRKLELQLRDAKREGDKEWVAELEDRIAELREQDVGDRALSQMRKLLKSQMDDRPEDDEEELEQIYELNPEISAELEEPMSVIGVLVEDPSVQKIDKWLKTVDPSVTRTDDQGVIGWVFGRDLSLVWALQNFPLRFTRTNDNQIVKHGNTLIVSGETASFKIDFWVDPRGQLDQIVVE